MLKPIVTVLRRKIRHISLLLIVYHLLFSMPSFAQAAVIVFDRVTTEGTSVYLKVLTKGRFFSQGGKRVSFYLDGKLYGKTLTGGDGYGFLKYTPQERGMQKIEVRTEQDKGRGHLLVLTRDEKVIVIEIEGSLKDTLYSESRRTESRKAVSALSQSYKIIYLGRFVGTDISKTWLEKEKFPISAVLRWRGSQTFEYLKENGVNLCVFIGSSDFFSESSEYFKDSYTFEKTDKGKKVEDWSEIVKLLLNGKKNDTASQGK